MADAKVRLRLAVRQLAQLTCRTGDIHFRYDDSAESHEGIALQKRLQRDRPSSYQREAAVKCTWENGEVELELTGRADGCDVQQRLVEEFKTTRIRPGAGLYTLGARSPRPAEALCRIARAD